MPGPINVIGDEIGDEKIGIHRDELLFLIDRYRELPDETSEEAAEIGHIPDRRRDAGEDPGKRSLALNRYNFALFAACPECLVNAGDDCGGTGHDARINPAFAALHKLRGPDDPSTERVISGAGETESLRV
jgi:hypothetical protein